MNRSELLAYLVNCIVDLNLAHPIRVGIDGIDAAGKTILADELVAPLQAHGRSVIRTSIDGFHFPRAVRYQNGRFSPAGYYEDSFDLTAVRDYLLQPLGPGGSLAYRRAIFDYRTNMALDAIWETAVPNAILLFDGVFLQKPEIRHLWDFTIFVDVDFQVSAARMAARDGLDPDMEHLLIQRYIGGQQLYFAACQPRQRTDIVIDNRDWKNPVVSRQPPQNPEAPFIID
jgi:uridine kinase